ncbi:M16 family metallopeptidase, partial [Bacteroidota bacterium]
MTYYIKSTDVVKDAASYYIIQNVGSILENEDQQGLAHFLEHMAFNGTESFPGKGILNTLQKHGAVFGKDINAYTSFDETVYNLNDIPTTENLINTCLTVLHDWSNYLLLTEEEIDAERGVIKEEWRTGQSGRRRLYDTSLPITFNHSKYSDRLPIGLMSIVESFDYKALRDFYHDWYRTDLQAIAVIGDVNVEEIEQKIIEKFSKIPAITNPKERYTVTIPNNEKMLYSLGLDPEVSSASIEFGMRHYKSLKNETVGDLKNNLIHSIITNLLNARISEQTQKPESSFLGAQIGYRSLSRTCRSLSLGVYPKKNRQADAFEAILKEIQRGVKFGFTSSEIERSKIQIKSSYENQIAKLNDKSHKSIERAIQNNYLENKTITDIKAEYEIVKQLFSNLTNNEIHEALKGLYIQNNRYLNVTGVEGQNNLTEEQAIQIIQSVENSTNLEPYKEALEGKTLLSDITINEGTIAKITKNKEIESTLFELSNGVKVYYKFANKQKDKVSLSAMSYGGLSLLDNEDLASANFMTKLVRSSGLGDFTSTDLRKILAGKTASVNIGLGDISEFLFGASNTKDTETMLQLVHLNFVKPRFDEQAFEVLKSSLNNYITQRSNNVNEKMKDSLTVTLYGKNNPKKRLFNEAYLSEISFDKIKKIYHDRFANISDFEFYIVGDINETQLRPLLEKYIASIPTEKVKENYKDNSVEWIANKIGKSIYLNMEDPKATVKILYKKELPYSRKTATYTRALGDILQLRVTESVREKEGGAYSPRANASFSRLPKSEISVSFNFDCNPDLADKLVTIVNGELEKIAQGKIKDEDLNKIKTNFIKERKQSKGKNNYDMQLLTT